MRDSTLKQPQETPMRRSLAATAAAVLAFGTTATLSSHAEAAKQPAKTKMGCVVGKEKWDASQGKCIAAAPVKKAAKKA
jgi:hypothetical protein